MSCAPAPSPCGRNLANVHPQHTAREECDHSLRMNTRKPGELQKRAGNTEREASCSLAEFTAANPKDAEEAVGPITEQLSWRQEAPGSWFPGQTPLGPSFLPD